MAVFFRSLFVVMTLLVVLFVLPSIAYASYPPTDVCHVNPTSEACIGEVDEPERIEVYETEDGHVLTDDDLPKTGTSPYGGILAGVALVGLGGYTLRRTTKN